MGKFLHFVILVVLTSSSLTAATFIWQNGKLNRNLPSGTPHEQITKLIQEEINTFITPKPALDLSALIPPEVTTPKQPEKIPKPTLPPADKLIKGEFEKTKDFLKRVEKAKAERERMIVAKQEEYRQKVEERNRQIEQLSIQYKKDVSKRNAILRRLQQINEYDLQKIEGERIKKKTDIVNHIADFAQNTMEHVYGAPHITYESYDADSEVLYLTIASDGGNFSKKVKIKVEPSIAQDMKSQIEGWRPKLLYDVTLDENNNLSLLLLDIVIPFSLYEFRAEAVDKVLVAKPIEITLKEEKVNFVEKSSVLDLQASTVDFYLQNPNLNDRYQVNALNYNEQGKLANFTDHLMKSIDDMSVSELMKNRWLFIIAIENYDETDPVVYSKQSAMAIKKLMQKRFGISERNTYALIEEKATSGAIKDNLTRLLQNVKHGDTIYFYYSGHGVPGSDGDAYILPKDKVVDFIDRDPMFKIENIYKKFSESNAKHTFAFIDACFSGRTDDVTLFKGTAATLLKRKKVSIDSNRISIITAGSDSQFSNGYAEKHHRLFSYYLAKTLLEQKTSSIDYLYKKLSVQVYEHSNAMGDRYRQEPQFYGAKNMSLF